METIYAEEARQVGVKVWCLCDSHTGYCLAFSVYTGTSTDGAANLDLGYRVVMRLMRHHLLSYHHLYADNYFTSVHLAVDLLHADTYLCGTTRATRREFPKTLTGVRLRQGESVKWTSEDGVMLCKWHDKRDVHMIATGNSGDDILSTCRCRSVLSTITIIWEAWIGSIRCEPTTVLGVLAGVGGSISSGDSSTSVSSTHTSCGLSPIDLYLPLHDSSG